MKYAHIFGKTIKAAPKDAMLASHKLLYQAGFIRESTAGRYYFLPLGQLVHKQIQQIIKEEMDATGAQEMLAPVLHPKSLWQETNRTKSVGFELMSIKDRSEVEFVLGGTAEEMLVDLVRKFQFSYKDIPFNLYQFSTKFRDEKRARGGLLRLREFVMKDAYSFDATEKEFKKEYQKMWDAYTRMFNRMGLKTIVVESDNGYIGGDYCHEFVVESEAGESKFYMTSDGSYAAHEEVTKFQREDKNRNENEKEMKEVDAIRGKTMQDGVTLHNVPLWQHIKNVLFVSDSGEFIQAVIRGDLDVNETKLLHAAKAYTLRAATEEEIRSIHSEPGFLSPVRAHNKVRLIGDISLRTIKNAVSGANQKNKDLININIDRDYKLHVEADIALAKEGDMAENGQRLIAKRGIEVGNIFQLGFHYTSQMTGATFMDVDGQQKPYYMGCYGIGLARTLATIVEIHHDKNGIIWPKTISPFEVYLISLKSNEKSDLLYNVLQEKRIKVLYDDREISAGQKFTDADLIGIPVRLVISAKTPEGHVEWKERQKEKSEIITIIEAIKRLKQ